MRRLAFLFLAMFAGLLFSLSWTQASEAEFSADAQSGVLVAGGSVILDYSQTWSDNAANPVFDPSTAAYYPSVIYDEAKFGGSSAYKMWYSDGTTHIGLATSGDGVQWAEFAGNPVAGLTNPHHCQVVYDSSGFGGTGVYYKIWYWDTAQLYSINAIRYAESADGVAWANDRAITGDIITGVCIGICDWNRGSYGPVDVFYNPNATNSGTSPFDYSYYMYFDGTTGGVEDVGLAYSTDGTNWSLYGTEPVLPLGAAGEWDSNYVGFGTVVKVSDNDWRFWYSGGKLEMGDGGVGYATSADGISWAKQGQVAELVPALYAWTAKRSYTPEVIYDPNRFSGNGDPAFFKMWRSGKSASSNYAVGYSIFPYASPGTLTSYSFDTVLNNAVFGNITWEADIPENTSLAVRTRTSADNVAWSAWSDETNGTAVTSPAARYIQYEAELSTSNASLTPALNSVTIEYAANSSNVTSDTGEPSLTMDIAVSGQCMAEPIGITSNDGSSPVSGVSLRILYHDVFGWEKAADLSTGSAGSAEFIPMRSGDYEITARKTGYVSETVDFTVERCAECYSDDECKDAESCSAGSCVAVQCGCGRIENHACAAYACCSSSQCGEESACEGNACVPVTRGSCGFVSNHSWHAYACCADSDCAADSVCSSNKCEQIAGSCGYAANHSWNQYACCSDSDCAGNETCLAHACEPIQGECGHAANHAWTAYECCADSDCASGDCDLELHQCVLVPAQPNILAALMADRNMPTTVIGSACALFFVIIVIVGAVFLLASRDKREKL